MVSVQSLRTIPLNGTFALRTDNVNWSEDYQIAVVFSQGVSIFKLNLETESKCHLFPVSSTLLQNPEEAHEPDVGLEFDSVFLGSSKRQIYDLMCDRLITPRGYSGIELSNCFMKATWSKAISISVGEYLNPTSLLACLTTNFQLTLYADVHPQDLRRGHLPSGPHLGTGIDCLLDITEVYNTLLLNSEWEHGEDSIRFYEYKERLYRLAIIDFVWLPIVKESKGLKIEELYLLTVHANGEFLIWSIRVLNEGTNGKKELNPTCTIVFKEYVSSSEFISTVSALNLNSTTLIVAFGFNTGEVKLFTILQEDSLDLNYTNSLFTLTNEMSHAIWPEADLIRIDQILLTKINDLTFDVVFNKNSHLIPCRVGLDPMSGKLLQNDYPIMKFQNGPLAGISPFIRSNEGDENNSYVLTFESGEISFVKLEKDGFELLGEIPIHGKRAKGFRWFNAGFSPNGVLGCLGSDLNVRYNHLVIRKPAAITFFSFLTQDVVSEMREIYFANDSKLSKSIDILNLYRFETRRLRSFDFRAFKDPLMEMNIKELQLFFWCVKAHSETSHEDEVPQHVQKSLLRKCEIIEDALMARHFLTILPKISPELQDSPNDELKVKSAHLIKQFLLSKNLIKETDTEIPAIIPLCPVCSSELNQKKISEVYPIQDSSDEDDEDDGDFFLEQIMDPLEDLPGLPWDGQTCKNEHSYPICISTLLHVEAPMRICETCGVMARLASYFGQDVFCPFDGTLMLPRPHPLIKGIELELDLKVEAVAENDSDDSSGSSNNGDEDLETNSSEDSIEEEEDETNVSC